MTLYPPWSSPKEASSKLAKEWQQHFFFDTTFLEQDPMCTLSQNCCRHFRKMVLECHQGWHEPAEVSLDML
eukprot:CAMPEP_0194776524 /NCGR_PEP_ID=MMETSP0323_2-20130528/63335_1 /TAXON_ID=2866 ORGANISM="Crypthecodinium cohnii, Strain Seligo" /NCGR_SAMPLE_ID=MMETSP0323_2 /ASSEMBLY_ACC=CAM_ASM_000346 /LENGTH=70 /DNA_ID=CAMNT_0039712969 /DNA_START=37 /DNA_END=249 /DNA_ORIENTATION=+